MECRTSDLKKLYEENWNPEKYLEEYISTENNPWEENLVSNLHNIVESGKIKGPRGIDVGCGPTVHRMSILARICEEILACDYAPKNLEFVKKYLESGGPVDRISESLKEIARLEGYKDLAVGEKALCDRLRSKIKHVVRFDVTDADSVKSLLNYGGQFDCAHSNGVLESACLTYEAYVKALKNINTLLKPGASFILSGYLKGNFYIVDGVNFECLKWDEDFVKKGLEEAGFKLDTFMEFKGSGWEYTICNCVDGFSSVSYKL